MARRDDGRKRPSRGSEWAYVEPSTATGDLSSQRRRWRTNARAPCRSGGVDLARDSDREATRARGRRLARRSARASEVESLGEVRATARVRPRALGLRYWQADRQGTAGRPCFSLASFSSAFIARESCR